MADTSSSEADEKNEIDEEETESKVQTPEAVNSEEPGVEQKTVTEREDRTSNSGRDDSVNVNDEKQSIILSLQTFESQRKSAFAERMKSNEKYWIALEAIVHESLEENMKVSAFLEMRAIAEDTYSESLYAIQDGVNAF